MDSIHSKLRTKLDWYDFWHNHPRHQHAHWLFFLSICLILTGLVLGQTITPFQENYIAQAQAGLTLGISGDTLTVNGTPQFLLFISYFDAMAASDATLDSDFAAFRSHGFNGIRIFPNWNPLDNPARLMDSNGNLRAGRMAALINIIQKAQANGLVVDVSFTRDTVSGLTPGGLQNGITSTTQALIPYRNLYFDITNEADHDGITCGSARLCPTEARQIRDAVKAIDPQRIVGISLAHGNYSAYGIPGLVDITLPHAGLSGAGAYIAQMKALTPGIPVHYQEPYRCRQSPCEYQTNEYISSATESKCAGAAGWDFHTGAAYNLSGGSMFNQWFDATVEGNVFNGLSGALANTSWFSCSGTGGPSGGGGSSSVIYYITSPSAPPGDTIIISGSNLGDSVSFTNSSGVASNFTGVLNSDNTEVTITVPNLTAGKYKVSVGPSPVSNLIDFEVLALQQGGPTTQGEDNDPIPCSSDLIQANVTIVCDFEPSSALPGATIIVSGNLLTGPAYLQSSESTTSGPPINGTSNSDGTIFTFTIPLNTTPGDYNIGVQGETGDDTGTKIFTVLSQATQPSEGNPPPFSNPIRAITNPPATDFSSLITSLFNYSILFVGIAVFIMIGWAGFLWLTSAANPANIARAKGMIRNAILGAILLLSAYVILYTINPELVGSGFTLEGLFNAGPASIGVQRLVAVDEEGAATAITAGCSIATELRDLTAVDCPSGIAELVGLPQDPIFDTLDANANQQIGATSLQTSGNNGAGRKIVILDSGYNYNHPELSSSYGGGYDFVDKDSDTMDQQSSGGGAPGHGSHVAGIITADGIDSRSRGVAPQAQIIEGRIANSEGKANWSDIIDGIYWAVNGPDGVRGTADDFNPDAINISMGGGIYGGICDNVDDTSKLMAKAIQYARDNGIITVVAAGNNSGGVTLPGCVDKAFTVSAVDSSNQIANFSGRGPAIDISAPGVNLYSSVLGTNYGTKSGTSMAAPVVSGLIALIKSANPNLTVDQLEQKIISDSCDLGSANRDNLYGWGRVSAIPGSCTQPNTTPPSNNQLVVSPTSCTKGTRAGNPNCDITIDYRLNGLPSGSSLTLSRDNAVIQNVSCDSSCSGQVVDPNPQSGDHNYIIKTTTGATIIQTTAYVYTTGGITAGFSSCAKASLAGNPDCDVTLNIDALGVAPFSLIVKKDGVNWRVFKCSNTACIGSLVDTNPAIGIHTYTIHDSNDDSRLSRVIITINGPNSSPNGPYFATLCSGVNYTGTCEDFYNSDGDLTNNRIGARQAKSLLGHAMLCQGPSLTGICETFYTNIPDLSTTFFGSDKAVSIRRGLGGGATLILCTGLNLTGTCETFVNVAVNDFRTTTVGNDTVQSMRVDSSDVTVCQDINYGGLCQDFPEGIYPDLRYHPIGSQTMSSFRAL